MDRQITIDKIDEHTWEVKGKGMLIITDTEEKAIDWKRIFKNKEEL